MFATKLLSFLKKNRITILYIVLLILFIASLAFGYVKLTDQKSKDQVNTPKSTSDFKQVESKPMDRSMYTPENSNSTSTVSGENSTTSSNTNQSNSPSADGLKSNTGENAIKNDEKIQETPPQTTQASEENSNENPSLKKK